MNMARYHLANRFTCSKVDRADGIIYGVSVATAGPAKGHKMYLDNETLRTTMDCAMTYENGLKVKGDHGSGVFSTLGRLKNFRIEGNRLRADLYVMETFEDKDKLFEMAETIPDTFGLSISFSGPNVIRKGKKFARCGEIYSADLVSEPAANPTGLFSTSSSLTRREMQGKLTKNRQFEAGSKGKQTMDEQETTETVASEANELDIKQLATVLTRIESRLTNLEAKKEEELCDEVPKKKKFKKGKDAKDNEADTEDEDEDDGEETELDNEDTGAAEITTVPKAMGVILREVRNLRNEMKIMRLSRRGSSAPVNVTNSTEDIKPSPKAAVNTKKDFATTFAEISAIPANAAKPKSERIELAIKNNPDGYLEWKQTGARTL